MNISKSKVYFNAIDKAHEILEGDRDLAQKVPSCVVVGMQSVGKSAVLSRISGIRFPQDSEVCTRVAIELRLRRSSNPSKVMMIKAGNFESKEIDKTNDTVVEDALRDAQEKVLDGRKFEDKLSVKVEKEDVDLPEVTLIDLPGVFFAKDDGSDDLEQKVKTMIKERVDNEMALIIHVIPLNQDTDTISTWRTVRDADDEQKRTISVLTKADLALESGKDNLKTRIKKIVSDSKSSECFVVHGSAKDIEEEESKLATVTNCIEELHLGHSVKVGIEELKESIEDRMLIHIKEKVPDMKRMLEDELRRTKNELETIGRQPLFPQSIAYRDLEIIDEHLNKTFASFQPVFRRLTETMTEKIFQMDMQPLGEVDALKANYDLKAKWSTMGYISNLKKEHHILALEVKKIGEDSRAMINVPFPGTSLQLKTWIKTLILPIQTVLEEYINDMFAGFFSHIIQPSIKSGSSEPTKSLSKNIEALIKRDVVFKTKSFAIEYAKDLVDSVGNNTYTTNDHYLTSTTKDFQDVFKSDFEDLGTDYKLTMTPYFNKVCEIRAFIKTRKKVLPETMQLHFTKVMGDLHQATKKGIRNQMLMESNLDMIKESSGNTKKRVFYLARENRITEALKEISLL